ncbi:hypothetical protein PR048_023769 [Dryococelus australis]|uniref:Uncharacterized protein n=1 Tax=Dryococelus australis TaxID=614101 RepID=A0ABQ9GUZ0_9NEOP|nr:hypothetical protein PR048_023769 [Dryococelus australis]
MWLYGAPVNALVNSEDEGSHASRDSWCGRAARYQEAEPQRPIVVPQKEVPTSTGEPDGTSSGTLMRPARSSASSATTRSNVQASGFFPSRRFVLYKSSWSENIPAVYYCSLGILSSTVNGHSCRNFIILFSTCSGEE